MGLEGRPFSDVRCLLFIRCGGGLKPETSGEDVGWSCIDTGAGCQLRYPPHCAFPDVLLAVLYPKSGHGQVIVNLPIVIVKMGLGP